MVTIQRGYFSSSQHFHTIQTCWKQAIQREHPRIDECHMHTKVGFSLNYQLLGSFFLKLDSWHSNQSKDSEACKNNQESHPCQLNQLSTCCFSFARRQGFWNVFLNLSFRLGKWTSTGYIHTPHNFCVLFVSWRILWFLVETPKDAAWKPQRIRFTPTNSWCLLLRARLRRFTGAKKSWTK